MIDVFTLYCFGATVYVVINIFIPVIGLHCLFVYRILSNIGHSSLMCRVCRSLSNLFIYNFSK